MSYSGQAYSVVGDTNPTTQVWEFASGQMVANTVAAYQAWVAAAGVAILGQPTIINVQDNGSGVCRVTVNFGGTDPGFVTNDVWVVQGTGTSADGTWPITKISEFVVDLQGSTFGATATAGTIGRGIPYATLAALLVDVNNYNTTLIPLGSNFYQETPVSIPSPPNSLALMNPLTAFTKITAAQPTAALLLPPMNVPGAIPIGMPFYVTMDKAITASTEVGLFYQDGVTQIPNSSFALIPGTTWLCVLRANSTKNGTVDVLGVFAEQNVLPTGLGGSENPISSPANGGTLYVQPGGASTNVEFGSRSITQFGQRWLQSTAASALPGWGALGFTFADQNFTISDMASPPFEVLATRATLTAPRTVTLPAANKCAAGTKLLIVDLARGASATNTISIAPSGIDTINGSNASYVAIAHAGGWASVTTDGASAWSTTDPSDAFLSMSGDAAATRAGVITIKKVNGNNPIATADGGTGAAKFNTVSVNLGGTDQTGIASGAFAKVNWSNKVSDPDGVFDVTTNHRYRPNVAGTFEVKANIEFTAGLADGAAYIVSLFKNGSEAFRGNQQIIGAAVGFCINSSWDVPMNGSTDYIEIFVFQNSGANATVGGAAALSWMTAQRIGP